MDWTLFYLWPALIISFIVLIIPSILIPIICSTHYCLMCLIVCQQSFSSDVSIIWNKLNPIVRFHLPDFRKHPCDSPGQGCFTPFNFVLHIWSNMNLIASNGKPRDTRKHFHAGKFYATPGEKNLISVRRTLNGFIPASVGFYMSRSATWGPINLRRQFTVFQVGVGT